MKPCPARIAFRTLKFASSPTWKATGDGTSVGLFIQLPPDLAGQFPDLGEEDTSPPHVTLLYVGDVPKDREAEFVSVLQTALGKERGPIQAALDGLDDFQHPHAGRRVHHCRVRFSKDMGVLRDHVWTALTDAGFVVQHSFPLAFFPHVTLEYTPGLFSSYTGPVPEGSWSFDAVSVWGMSKTADIALGAR